MATSPVATLPPGYAVEPPTVATLKSTDVAATHELGPNGIAAKSSPTLPPGYSIEGQQPPVPALSPDQTLSRTHANMAAAMSGQPQSTPEDQANFDEGRKSGTIQGGVDIGLGALGGAALGPLDNALKYLGFGAKAAKAAEPVATGLLDQYGSPIFRALEPEVRPIVQKLLSHEAVQKGLKIAGQELLKGALYTGGGTALYKAVHYLLE